jgi:hypothetical protein
MFGGNVVSFFKKIAIFFIGAVLPATFFIGVNTLLIGNCDPKFGCMGTFGFVFKFSVLPIAVISSISVFGAMILLGIFKKPAPTNNILVFGAGVLISVSNIWSFKLVATQGFFITISTIMVLSCITFFILNQMNITKD